MSGVLKTLLHRAHSLCDKKDDLIDELEILNTVFIQNGYPERLVKHIIQNSWKDEIMKMLKKAEDTKKENSNERSYYDVLHAPYVQNFSEKLQKDLKKLNVGYVMKKGRTIGSVLMHLKPQRAQTETKDIVYGIQCSTCKKMYIGETGQKMCQRRKQHQSDVRRKIKTNGI